MFYELSHISSTDYFKKIYCKNFSFPPHMHNCFELVVNLEGETQITVDKKDFSLKKDEAVLVFPHQLHSFAYSESRILICIFSPKLVSAYYKSRSALIPENNKFSLPMGIIKAFDEYDGCGNSLFEKGMLYLVCDEFNKDACYCQNTDKSLLEKIFLFVNENSAGDCSLKNIAGGVGYNPSYVSRFFKKSVGINLSDYVIMVRLGNVCHLYENSNATLLSLALDSGFDSLRTFNRNFKKFYGMPPKEYFKSMEK